MSDNRIKHHPILNTDDSVEWVTFFWKDEVFKAKKGEMLASALIANDVMIFGEHRKDHAPLGIFCANGQCSQCMVFADHVPVKSCMTPAKEGMRVEPMIGLPVLPEVNTCLQPADIEKRTCQALIIGGGPAGMSAAIELGKLGIETIIVEDKDHLGGKLVLQTHRFFGSVEAVYAGTRGIDIAKILARDVEQQNTVEVWLNSTALSVFSDHYVGVLKNNHQYVLLKPEILIVAAGAREKALAFNGNTLPGVYGAGAFQTLVNRDLVKAAKRLFIVGGGNVGLIAGYHALQADIKVVGLVEAMAECGGYKVHKDKLHRLGVPIYTSHTILSANGFDRVESVTIAQVDEHFLPIAGTEKSFECDTVLIAVGLDPVDEFTHKAEEYGMPVLAAGDAKEIAEASAAIFSGKITGLQAAQSLGYPVGEIPQEWIATGEVLKSKPGQVLRADNLNEMDAGVIPVIHCSQEIPCDPCTALCINGLISLRGDDIRSVPTFVGNNYSCAACERCVAGCPGLAITLVDFRFNPDFPYVSIPYEFDKEMILSSDLVTVIDTEGNALGDAEVINVHSIPTSDSTFIVQVQVPKVIARDIAGLRLQNPTVNQPMDRYVKHIEDDTIVCRCERVTAREIRELIRKGYRDFNEIKAVTRAGMGACGGKTCTALILRLFREENIPLDEVTMNVKRPLFVEVPLGVFAGLDEGDNE